MTKRLFSNHFKERAAAAADKYGLNIIWRNIIAKDEVSYSVKQTWVTIVVTYGAEVWGFKSYLCASFENRFKIHSQEIDYLFNHPK